MDTDQADMRGFIVGIYDRASKGDPSRVNPSYSAIVGSLKNRERINKRQAKRLGDRAVRHFAGMQINSTGNWSR